MSLRRFSSTNCSSGAGEDKTSSRGLDSHQETSNSSPTAHSNELPKRSSVMDSESSSLQSVESCKEPPPCPNHAPAKSALSLPIFTDTVDKSLKHATWEKPARIIMVILQDHEPCCESELRVSQGDYVTVFFERKQWLYVEMAKKSQAGYVPSALCSRASLHQPSVDSGVSSEACELDDSLSDLYQPSPSAHSRSFSPAVHTNSPHHGRWRRASTAECRSAQSDSEVGGCQRQATSMPPSPQVQTDTESLCKRGRRSLNFTAATPSPKRFETHHHFLPRPASVDPNQINRSRANSDNKVPHVPAKLATLPADTPCPNTSANAKERSRKRMIMDRFRSFRTLGPSTVYEVFNGNGNSPHPNAVNGETSTMGIESTAIRSKVKKADQRPTHSGKGSQSDISSKSSRRSFFSRLSGRRKSRGSQTDTEVMSERRRCWQDHDDNMVQTDTEVTVTRARYFPVRRTASVVVFPSSEEPQTHQDRHRSRNSGPGRLEERLCSQSSQSRRLSVASPERYHPRTSQSHFQPCVVQFDFTPQRPNQLPVHRNQHVWQLNIDDGERLPAGQAPAWVQVLDPWTKTRGFVPRACLSPLVPHSTVL